MNFNAIDIFYRYFQGALLLQSIVFFCIFLIFRRREFLFYMLYLVTLAISYSINASGRLLNIPANEPAMAFLIKNVNMPLVMLSNVFYLFFISSFLGLKRYRDIYQLIKLLLGIVIFSFILYIVLRLFHQRVNIILNIVNISGLLGGLALAIIIIRKKIQYGGFISVGILLYSMGSIASAATVIISKSDATIPFAKNALIYVKIGVLADMILYFIALISKWINTERKLALTAIESELKVEKERSRIKRDFHDEIGASLSGIAMYSHLGKEQIKAHNLEEAEKSLNIMQQSATDAVDKLNEIVWLMNPGQDNLKKLVQRLEEYALEMTAAKDIRLQTLMPDNFAVLNLPVESRRNIYLFCKEAINNAVKYSGGNMLELTVKESNQILEISISDNGKGFDAENVKRGNGLDNMQKRAAELGAEVDIQSKPGEGCSILLKLKITQ